jgi:RNA polymerase sigma-70 factor (ECF subfamily)
MSASPLAIPQDSIQQQVHELYVHHQSWLHGWLRNKLDCSHQASDLTQDTFVRLLKTRQLLNLNEPRAFLTTVAKRVLSNHWRRQQLERVYFEALMQVPECHAPSEEEQAILLETLNAIDQLLDGLPSVVKQAFLHSQLDGMKQQEIAQQLDISVTTVKRYLVRASAQCFFALSTD